MPQSAEQQYEELEHILTQYMTEHNMRKTAERYAVLDQVCKQRQHFSAEKIHTELSQNFPVSLATVYNTLQLFEKCNIVHRLERKTGETHNQYERSKRRGIVMQFICTNCGRQQDFYDKNITGAINMHRFSNFNPANFSLYVYGTCKYCHKNIQKK